MLAFTELVVVHHLAQGFCQRAVLAAPLFLRVTGFVVDGSVRVGELLRQVFRERVIQPRLLEVVDDGRAIPNKLLFPLPLVVEREAVFVDVPLLAVGLGSFLRGCSFALQ